jgi:hypothetical protein
LPAEALFLAALMSMHGAADSILHVWMARFLESDSFPAELLAPGLVLSGRALAYLRARGALAAIPDRIGRRAFFIFPGLIGGGVLIAGILSRSHLLTAGGYVLGAEVSDHALLEIGGEAGVVEEPVGGLVGYGGAEAFELGHGNSLIEFGWEGIVTASWPCAMNNEQPKMINRQCPGGGKINSEV